MRQVFVRVFGPLNDFLHPELRKCAHGVRLHTGQSVKDLIESLGIPHVEVAAITVNNRFTGFSTLPAEEDYICVYPEFFSFRLSGKDRLSPPPKRIPRFVLDVHLGKLTRLLRFAGFDSKSDRMWDDQTIALVSADEDRILLTRDRLLLKRSIVRRGYFVRSTDPAMQLKEVARRFQLEETADVFARCTSCNGRLGKIDRDEAAERVPSGVLKTGRAFNRCMKCGKIYWFGTHAERIIQMLEQSGLSVSPEIKGQTK